MRAYLDRGKNTGRANYRALHSCRPMRAAPRYFSKFHNEKDRREKDRWKMGILSSIYAIREREYRHSGALIALLDLASDNLFGSFLLLMHRATSCFDTHAISRDLS